MKHYWTIFLFCLIGCGKTAAPPVPVILVEVGEVTQSDVPIFVEAIGNVSSLLTVQVRPQVGGMITNTYITQGAFVKKDQILYKIDPRPFQAILDKAKATLLKDIAALQLAETKVKRYQELVTKNYVSQLSFEELQTDVDLNKAQIMVDKAEVDTAQLNLDYSTIKAPMDGRISQFRVDTGNVVVANDQNALTEIRQIDPAEVDFSISQNTFFDIKEALANQTLTMYVNLPEMTEPRKGEVFFIDNHVDLQTGTILLKGVVPNKDYLLWPGEFVTVRLLLKTQKNALLVPEGTVQVGQNGFYLYVYNSETSTVELRNVKVGNKFEHMTVINEGVRLGEKVVTNGQINLRPGAKVAIAHPDALQPDKSKGVQ